MAELVQRRAVRALILTPQGELLLIKVRSPDGQVFWIAPGGGIESSESVDEALRRELKEELGLVDFRAGPVVWRRHHTFNWGERRFSQHEEYRIVNAERFEAAMGDATEAAFTTELKWWRIADLGQASERLTPPSLATIIGEYLENGAPSELPPVEVTVE
jgi:8-oxo-dGTP pyrophosphatase MutT (NUDIX family)